MATGVIKNADAIPLLKPPPIYLGIFMIFHNFLSPFPAKLMSHHVPDDLFDSLILCSKSVNDIWL